MLIFVFSKYNSDGRRGWFKKHGLNGLKLSDYGAEKTLIMPVL